MSDPPRLYFLLVVALGCASRSVPTRHPARAAVAPSAPEAPVADPTVALTSDPPLPGEPVGPWTGLAVDAGTAAPPPVHVHAH